jgi:pyruvate/2-oxoacid:ferredoxin oxidoreductase beta subunit/Pyruvate/2-oxoacid:ferredoxin oxidoreductase gamma subunit
MTDSFLNPKIPFPFCQGCGQSKVLNALDKAMVSTGLSEKELVFVTDIGCSGLSDRHFTTNAFHGLHGRSITYGTGIHLARPDLKVLVLIGDGGCGIGGAHLLNAARRNVGITVLVANNFNFGMTGGEHSPTTPVGGITSTTPGGNVESPLDLCKVVEAAGGTFVARASAFDKNLHEVMAQALAHDGFSFIDVWSLCSAYFATSNKQTPKKLVEGMSLPGMGMGVLHTEQRPELASIMAEKAEGAQRITLGLSVEHESALANPMGVILAGSAGQRIRSGAALIGTAALTSGLYATQKDDYPITVRTGHSVSEIILAPEEILYTEIESPDALLLLSKDGLRQVAGRIENMGEGSLLLAEEDVEFEQPSGVEVKTFPFRAKALRAGKSSPSVVALATLVGIKGMVPRQALLESASSHGNPKIADSNRRAVEAGFELAESRSG